MKGDTVMIVRRDGKIFDYVLPGEEVRSWEVVCEEKVVEVMEELKKTLSRGRGVVGEL
ncbi:Paratox [Streptococcus suis]|nr:Paratox [Streptococcus suis]